MANCADSEGFVLLSGPRTGLKREFAFALKAQSELFGSLGRTRASKLQKCPSSNGVSENSSNKRFKSCSSSSNDELDKNSVTKNHLVKSPSDEEQKSDLTMSQTSEEPNFDSLKSPTSEEPSTNLVGSPKAEGTGAETRIVIDVNRERNNASLEKPLKFYTRSAFKRKTEPKEISFSVKTSGSSIDEATVTVDVCKDEAIVTVDDCKNEAIVSVDVCKNEGIVTVDDCKNEATISADVCMNEAIVTVDDCKNEAIVSADVCINEEIVTVDDCKNEATISADIWMNEAIATVDVCRNEAIISADVCKNEAIVKVDLCRNEAIISADVCKTEAIVSADVCKNEAIVSADVCKNEAIVSADVCNNEDIASADVSKNEAIVSSDVCKNEAIVVSSDVCKNEAIVVTADVCINEATAEGEGKTTDMASPLRTPSTNKLEMKMSKKIALTKFPTKTKELLETGMLEGLPIRYIFGKKKEGLKGMIKDCGILCFCSSCKGCNVVTPLQFERHAGSGNKRAPDYIYLENGNTIRDVLNACKDAPLDTLEATIQSAICSSPVKKATVCLNCKRPLPASRIMKTAILCTSCLELKKSQASPACMSGANTRSLKSVLTPKSSESASKCASRQNKSNRGKLTRKDLRLHKLVFEEEGLPDGTELAYYIRGQKLLEGYKKGFGIFCRCCNSEVSPSQFEAHAGWASRRKPYLNIYTSNGVSLHELSVSLSKGRKFSAKDNDDLCSICADFGDLLLCDGCPRAFHRDCVGLSTVPHGKWYCSYCQLLYQREKFCEHNENAKAAGRVSGEDPIEQITQRCIRTVKIQDTEVGGCVLCRSHGFSKSGFGPRTVLLCDQCEKEYHVGCLKDHKMADLRELPEGEWFCCTDCNRIHSALQELLVRGPEKLPDSVSHVIKAKHVEGSSDDNDDLDVRWTLLSGKLATPECRLLLSKAVAIFHDRFDPIVDSKTGRDLIPSMVYGRNIRDQEFGGMYCAVLTANSTVVSAGILRIFGREVAELPLVATSSENQGRGYFQSLFSCVEQLLGSLNVKNLALPAAEEAESIWTNKFSFKKMTQDQLSVYRRDCQMMTFQGTSMLEKPVPRCPIVGNSTVVRGFELVYREKRYFPWSIKRDIFVATERKN
ncbi:zinc finger protein [Macleaya cordata]|uniref:Zinc finger protein n=1 Tax=Macleaya cordata TaxID=56857 RepID=A0A200R5E7_MACCD|nr:zinc finger protein [Macleaya cordata]